MKNRNEIIDILRGFAICLIVLGHTQFVGTSYIYLFHVSVFIIASGMFFRITKVQTFKDLLIYIKRKILSLYVPYVIVNLLFMLLNNVLIKTNVYSFEIHQYYGIMDFAKNGIKILCFRGVTELAGATWFLHLIFILTVSYASISFILLKIFNTKINIIKIAQGIISLILLMIGFILTKVPYKEFLSIYIISMNCYWLLYVGELFNDIQKHLQKTKLKLLIVLGSILALFLLNQVGIIEISKNMYTSPLFFIVCSIIGWVLLYYISIIFSRFTNIMKPIKYLGENSLQILLFHFVGFKVVNIIIYLFVSHDLKHLSSFPTAMGGAYCLLYFIFGIVVSLMIYQLYIILKKNIYERK